MCCEKTTWRTSPATERSWRRTSPSPPSTRPASPCWSTVRPTSGKNCSPCPSCQSETAPRRPTVAKCLTVVTRRLAIVTRRLAILTKSLAIVTRRLAVLIKSLAFPTRRLDAVTVSTLTAVTADEREKAKENPTQRVSFGVMEECLI